MRWTLKRDGGAGSRGCPAGRGSVHNHPGASSGQQPGAKARVRTPEPNHQPPSLGGHPPPGTSPQKRSKTLGPLGRGLSVVLETGQWRSPQETDTGRRPSPPAPARSPGPGNTHLKAVAFVYLNASLSPWGRRGAGEGGWGAGAPRPTRKDAFLCWAESRSCLQTHLSP